MDILENLPKARNEPHTKFVQRTGYVPLAITARAMVRCDDGVSREFECAPREAVLARAESQDRKLALRVIVFADDRRRDVQRFFPSVDAMEAHYGDPVSLKLAGATVTWAFFCADPRDSDHVEKVAALDREMEGRRAVLKKLSSDLLNPKDAEAFDQIRGRIEGQRLALAENERQRALFITRVVGLLGDDLWKGELPPERTISTSTFAGGLDAAV